MSLLDGEPRSATVKAETDLRVLVINRLHFWQLLREVPELTQRMLLNLSRRIRDSRTRRTPERHPPLRSAPDFVSVATLFAFGMAERASGKAVQAAATPSL